MKKVFLWFMKLWQAIKIVLPFFNTPKAKSKLAEIYKQLKEL